MSKAAARARNRLQLVRSDEPGGGRAQNPGRRDNPVADQGFAAWPMCAECSLLKGHWVPVEGYSREELPKGSFFTLKKRVVIQAECSHGRGSEHMNAQHVIIDVPHYWGVAQEFTAIKKLVFFRPGVKPENRMLV